MKLKTITIAGGSGFLGQVLENHFLEKGHTIYILTRNPKRTNAIFWNAKDLDSWTSILEQTDILINLTGKSVDCRYTEANKKLIHDSRIDSTRLLGQALEHCKSSPKMWLNMSTSTIYEDSYTKEMTETNGDIGDDFSMNIAKSWESAFNTIEAFSTKKVILRTSIVFGQKGGAFIPLKRLAQYGLGGKQWHGKQKVSWIHETDFAEAIGFIIEHTLEGTFNIVSPKSTTNKALMSALRKVLKVPFGISHPKWLLQLGAKLIGTESELVLKSRNVIPENLIDNGFKFKYLKIEDALSSLVKS